MCSSSSARECVRRDTADGRIGAGIKYVPRPQEAADVICAVHGAAYLNASFALRSCSALMPGPNNFSKKPSLTSRLTMLLSMTL